MTYLSKIINGQLIKQTVARPTFQKEYDVIVCGLGTAGYLSALYCAENGLSVLGIEKFTCVGGTQTIGGIVGHYFGCPGGRYEKFDSEVYEIVGRYTFTSTESRKLLAEKKLIEQGAEILFESSCCGVYLEENTVIGIKVLTKQGVLDFGAKFVLDCTAEAFVSSIAGCETEMGREADGQAQPYSLVSMVYDHNKYGYTNVDFGRVNQFDQFELSEAILFSRSYKIAEGHSGTTICQMPLLGIREGRRIIPEETVRLEDLFADNQTQTPMFYSYADLDKHGWDIAFDGETLGDWAIGANLGAYNVTVAVPYKAILPKNYDGILVPCRAVGVDRDISSCVRMIPDMKKMAEAAAEWVALAIKQNKKLREVPYQQLKEKLTASGCLNELHNRGYRIDGQRDWDGSPLTVRDVIWITDPLKLEEELKTEAPGRAIWSAKRMGKKSHPVLKALLDSPDQNQKKHSAFALAIIGSQDACPVLREMVSCRDGLMLKDSRKNNNLRGCMAIYWLGRLADRDITEELCQLVSSPDEINRPIYHQSGLRTTRYKISEYNDTYFQFMSESVMALIRIGDRHIDLREKIRESFILAFSSHDYYHRITRRPPLSSEGNMVKALKEISFSAIKRWNS